MKKRYLAALFLGILTVLASQPVRAQSEFGIRAGVNFANFYDHPDNVNPDSRTGLMIGSYFRYNIPFSPLSIQPEVLYSQKGFESGNATLKLDYLEIPVLAKYYFAPGRITPHIIAGPYVGFVVNNELSGNGITLVVNDAQTDYGGVVGVGADMLLGLTKLNLGVRYSFGLRDSVSGTQGKNNALSIVAGINL